MAEAEGEQREVKQEQPKRKAGGYKQIRPEDGIATRFKRGEQQAKVARKGSAAAAEAKRRKKTNKELILSLLTCRPDLPQATKESLKKLGISGANAGNAPDDYTIELIATSAMMQKAMKGDIRAYQLMLQIIGEKPVQTYVVQKDVSTTRQVEDALFGDDNENSGEG